MNETADKVDFLQSKLLTIEKHLPVMIQEILEYYFDKKVSDLLSKLVTKEEFKERLSVKLDYCVFRDYEKMVAMDRTQEKKNFDYEEQLFKLERAFLNYVTKEDQIIELSDKVSLTKFDELQNSFHSLQSINVTLEENLT